MQKLSRLFFIITITLFISSCTAFKIGNIHGAYKNHVFPANSTLGLEVMELEEKLDPTVLAYNKNNEVPDYIYIGGTYEIDYIYTTPEKMVHFQRGLSPISKVTETNKIPYNLKRKISILYPKASSPPLTPSPSTVSHNEAKKWKGYGTGFAVNKNRIVTANHVIGLAKNVEVKFEGEKYWKKAHITRRSMTTDLAVLEIETELPNWINVTPFPLDDIGSEVFTIGYPAVNILGDEPKYTSGAISSLSGPGNDDTFIQVTVPIQPGNSGGPLLNNNGQLIGVVTSSAAILNFLKYTGTLPQNISWAVKSNYLLPLIHQEETNNVTFSLNTKAELVKHVKKSICLIRVK